MSNIFIHETAIIDEEVDIGENTKICAFSHVIQGTKILKEMAYE